VAGDLDGRSLTTAIRVPNAATLGKFITKYVIEPIPLLPGFWDFIMSVSSVFCSAIPVLPALDISSSVTFYEQQLGFASKFKFDD
jgi:hypothetical protein